MNKYGAGSQTQWSTLHPVLQILFLAVLSRCDHTLIEGHRGKKKQDDYFELKASTKKFPDSKHNKLPSLAVDASPFIDGKFSSHVSECAVFGTQVMYMAHELGMDFIRWGGDWDGDRNIHEHKLKDFWHFEIDTTKYRKTAWFQMYGL